MQREDVFGETPPIANEVDAVLKAAGNWVAALEALVTARQASGETEAEQEAVDIAGLLLVMAVKDWRSTVGRD
jgi:hypothetical protein